MSESFVGFVGTPLLCFGNYFSISIKKHGGGMPTKPTKLCDMQSLCIGTAENKNLNHQTTHYTLCI